MKCLKIETKEIKKRKNGFYSENLKFFVKKLINSKKEIQNQANFIPIFAMKINIH
jgi:hypothetical protein